MVHTLFPEMVHSVFQPLLDRLGQEKQDFAPDEVREILLACGVGAAVIDRLFEMLQKLLERGLEGRRACSLQREFAEVVELALTKVYARARAITIVSTLLEEERLAGLETLDEFTSRAVAIRNELGELQRWLERPTPAVDLAKILGEPASEAYEGYVDSANLEP